MTTSFSTLSTDDVDTLIKSFLDMFGVSDHLAVSSYRERGTYVHDEDTGFMKLLHNFLGRYTDCADEQLGLFLNDNINQFIEFTLGIIVVGLSSIGSKGRNQ